MKLKLVKQGDFLGIKCDFYIDEDNNIYMSRTQIGYALKYKDPSNAVLRVHQRHYKRLDKLSVEVEGCQFVTPYKTNNDKKAHTFMYSEKGIYEVCRHSKQAIADEFYDWVYETIRTIKKNGYYIATEKDSHWLGVRENGKKTRRLETDGIKVFIEYAKEHGSSSADKYYIHFSKMVRNKLDIPKETERDKLTQEQLLKIIGLETLIGMKLHSLMNEKIGYKKIY